MNVTLARQVVISNCIFKNNTADWGGAIGLTGSDALIENCVFEGNSAIRNLEGEGGAIWAQVYTGNVVNCTFRSNTAYRGGAMWLSSWATPDVVNCVFDSNRADDPVWAGGGGGAVYNAYRSPARYISCLFMNNYADSRGGAMEFIGPGTVINCTFRNNFARSGGAA